LIEAVTTQGLIVRFRGPWANGVLSQFFDVIFASRA
jgi:hypothetical protein